MTLPEGPSLPPAETSEKEYTFDDIADIIYWSFEVSQGIPGQQRVTYINLLERYPTLLAKVGEWGAHLGKRTDIEGSNWQKDPVVTALIARVQKRRNNPIAHTSPNTPANDGLAARMVADQIDSLIGVHRQLTTKERPGGDPTWAFVLGIADRDIILSTPGNISSDMPGMSEARARIGGSRLGWFALSEKREEHLDATLQSPEIKALWREVGDYVRANYATMAPQLKGKIDAVVQIYREYAGEDIKLGQ